MKGAFFVFQLNMGLLHATVDANIIRSLKAIDEEKISKKNHHTSRRLNDLNSPMRYNKALFQTDLGVN